MTNPVVVVAGLAFAGLGLVALVQYREYDVERGSRTRRHSALFVLAVVPMVAAGVAVAAVAWTDGGDPVPLLGAAGLSAGVAAVAERGVRRRTGGEAAPRDGTGE